MNIERFHEPHAFSGPHQGGPAIHGSVQSAAGSDSGQRPRAGDDSVPTDGLGRLMDSLQSVPDIRSDVVASARAQVASGELLTRAAAVETAQAFLRLS